MTDAEIVECLIETATRYAEYREKWIQFTGSEYGYDQWFTQQIFPNGLPHDHA